VRERILLACAVALVAAGALSAAFVDDSPDPAACVRGVADRLGYDVQSDVLIEGDDDAWSSTVPVDRVVLQVGGEGGRVRSVAAYAGAGADVLERPARLEALSVRC
jgi:hypothetical protein